MIALFYFFESYILKIKAVISYTIANKLTNVINPSCQDEKCPSIMEHFTSYDIDDKEA